MKKISEEQIAEIINYVKQRRTHLIRQFLSSLEDCHDTAFEKVIAELDLAPLFHEVYEKVASGEGWKTQEDCRVSFDSLPEKNKQTMIKTCEIIKKEINDKFEEVKK